MNIVLVIFISLEPSVFENNRVSWLTAQEIQHSTVVYELPYLLKYKSHFFVPENQSKNGGATYTRG